MSDEDSVREAVRVGALVLMGNRSVELKGLGELDVVAWKRIQPGIEALCAVKDFETRCKHLVPVVTRVLTDVTFEFWQHRQDEPC